MSWINFVIACAGWSFIDTKTNQPIAKYVLYERLKDYPSQMLSLAAGQNGRYTRTLSVGWSHDGNELVPQFDYEYDDVLKKTFKKLYSQKRLML